MPVAAARFPGETKPTAKTPGIQIVYLRGDKSLIASRLRNRSDHFMPTALLESQLDTLEEPSGPEVTTVDLALPPEEIVASVPLPLPDPFS